MLFKLNGINMEMNILIHKVVKKSPEIRKKNNNKFNDGLSVEQI
ncbi:hypothetical protein [Plasmodium yoelii yoelii]|uniref:Uncharacterized protein n=1 Tax=Plasmodium yoelii yoelii TaxID=73239 RepID=Q7REK6_PLAYO|nr:hypothetical protein [Plasmodium yoelii yoelii]